MQHPQTSLQLKNNDLGQLDYFLICGLGSLGQHCVLALKAFEVNVIAIEQIRPQSWGNCRFDRFFRFINYW